MKNERKISKDQLYNEVTSNYVKKFACFGSANNGKTTMFKKIVSDLEININGIGEFVSKAVNERPNLVINENATKKDKKELLDFAENFFYDIYDEFTSNIIADRCFLDLITFQTTVDDKASVDNWINEQKENIIKCLNYFDTIFCFTHQYPVKVSSSNNTLRSKDPEYLKSMHNHFLFCSEKIIEFAEKNNVSCNIVLVGE